MTEVALAWWQAAPALARQLDAAPVPAVSEWYRLGDGYPELRSGDGPCRERPEPPA